MNLLAHLKSRVMPSTAISVAKPTRPEAARIVKAEPVHFSVLTADQRAKARERLAFVECVDHLKKEHGVTAEIACTLAAAKHAAEFPILVRAGKHGASALTYSNYRNWRRICRVKSGEALLIALADNYNNQERQLFGDPDFWKNFNRMFLNTNRLPLTVALENAAKITIAANPGALIPSLDQVRYYVDQKLSTETLILAREGESAYTQKVLSWIKRDWTEVDAGQVVIGDSRTFDTRVKVWSDKLNKWISKRPTVAALIDAKSWHFSAWWITVEPVNAHTLINTLALYCHNTGGVPPKVAYFDNGKDYCAAGFSTPVVADGIEHSIFKELGITLVNSTAYNARAKTIERSFRDMMQNFDKLFPDYLGSCPDERTMAAAYFDKHAEELPSLKEFIDFFADYLVKYHDTPKHGDIHRGATPSAVWANRPQRTGLTDAELCMAFALPVGMRQVGRGPAIQYDNQFYYAGCLKFGEKVLIKVSCSDPTAVHCFEPSGAYICTARTREAIAAIAADDDSRAKLKALIAGQRRQLADAKTIIADLTGLRHAVSPLELLLAPVDAAPVVMGRIGSVKGQAHAYTRASFEGIDFVETPVEKMERVLTAAETAETAPQLEVDPDDLDKFHRLMTDNKKNEWDTE